MLYIKKSKLPIKGLGLFTDDAIPKGTLVALYSGEKISSKLADKRILAGRGAYILNSTGQVYLDARKNLKCLARYANDAAGPSRKAGLRNNCQFIYYKKKVWIYNTRSLKAGEEIFVPYGKDYWSVHAE